MSALFNQNSERQIASIEYLPLGASDSSNMLSTTVINLLETIHLGVGQGSRLLFQEADRVRNDFVQTKSKAIWLTQKEIRSLETWPEGWNGYDACAPSLEAIQYAVDWVRSFYFEIIKARLDWLAPNVTADAEGEVVLEWRYDLKNLSIYIGPQNVSYVKDWGVDMNTEMEDGSIVSSSTILALWKWLIN